MINKAIHINTKDNNIIADINDDAMFGIKALYTIVYGAYNDDLAMNALLEGNLACCVCRTNESDAITINRVKDAEEVSGSHLRYTVCKNFRKV